MRESLFWMVVVFWACALPGRAQIEVSARVDSSYLMIGDQVNLEIFVTHSPGLHVLDPDLTTLDTMQAIEVLQRYPWDTVSLSPEVVLRRRFVLSSFQPGQHEVPPIIIPYRQAGTQRRVATRPVPITVADLPAEGDPNAIMPIKPIIEEPLRFQDFLPYLLGIAGLGLIVALVVVLMRRRRETPPAPEVVIPPHELALQKLEKLRAEKLWQQGETKRFQSELSYILREYLENRFHLPALEMTSSETLRRLPTLNLPSDWQPRLRDVFQVADLVKFAKAQPTASLHEQAMQTVETFVRQTIPPPPAEEEESASGGATADKP